MKKAKFIFVAGGITSGIFGMISGLSWGFGLLLFRNIYSSLLVVQEVFQILFVATAVATVLVGVGFTLDEILPVVKK
ncbi:hypothetical protein AYK25_06195 [Thermoplasmatales archaeon SM1-50]|nr:MAG: hypothetical protein AYK25_06195 [Thermoplasmatales archaeon SM1-50]